MHPISLTWKNKNRLDKLALQGVVGENFSPDSVDLIDDFSNFQENNVRVIDACRGFNRLLNQPKLVESLVKRLQQKTKASGSIYCRHVVSLPDDFDNYDSLRDVFIEAHAQSGIGRQYVFTNRSETFEAIDAYMRKVPKEAVLVLDAGMNSEALHQLLNKYIAICEEVVLIYREPSSSVDYRFLLAFAKSNPPKLHMALVPLDVNSFGRKRLFSTLLICNNFKSVSFTDNKVGFIPQRRDAQPKSFEEKIRNARWVDVDSMSYQKTHRETCACLGDNDLEELCQECGVSAVVTYHNLNALSISYKKIQENSQEKEKILALDSMQSLLNSLQAT